MSFSFQLPEEYPICECQYDAVRDRMDREDCPFHCDMPENPIPVDVQTLVRKPPTLALGVADISQTTKR
jgi:hypothetical protein